MASAATESISTAPVASGWIVRVIPSEERHHIDFQFWPSVATAFRDQRCRMVRDTSGHAEAAA
jgi:hypothetical protein